MTKRNSVLAALCFLAVGLMTACTADPPPSFYRDPSVYRERLPALLEQLESGGRQPEITGDWKQVVGRDWMLERLDGGPLEPGSEVTISFSPELRLFRGGADARTYAGRYMLWSVSNLASVELAISSREYLSPPVLPMEQDGRYLRLLEQVDAFRLDGEILMLASFARS